MGIALRLVAAAAVTACVLPAADLASIPVAHASVRAAGPTGVVAVAGELVNVATGSRMWSREKNAELPIASITKVMTAMVVLSQGDLNRKIMVTEAAVSYAQENSAGSAGLVPGDILTASQLLQGLLLPSGADAASSTISRTAFSASSARIRNVLSRARSAGIVVRASHRPLTCRNKSS